jgi:hypothetical protein
MDYPKLVTILEQPTYAGLSDNGALAAVNAKTVAQTYSRFGSLRTLAALLTPEEYAAVKATIEAAATQNVMVSDMLTFLKLPGDEAGNGGGIDLGNASVRAMLDSLCALEVAAKIKSYAETLISLAEFEELDEVGLGHIQSARQMIEEKNQ